MAPLAFPANSGSTTTDRLLVIRDSAEGAGSIILEYIAVEQGRTAAIATGSASPPATTVARLREQAQALDHLNAIDLNRLGYELCSLALPGAILTKLETDIADARKTGKRLRIHVDDRDSALSGLPWEFLWSGSEGFISINPHCSVVRASRSAQRNRCYHISPHGDRLHLLIVWADPGAPYQTLDALPQIDTIARLARDLSPGTLDISTLLPREHASDGSEIATLTNLSRILGEHPVHILFFLTHGDFDTELAQGVIVLEGDEPGSTFQRVSAGELETLIASGPTPYVIIFDGCRSASRGPDGKGTSIAEAVARHGHSVVGMQYLWPAAACHPFWREFFRMLSVPRSLDECIFSARDYLYRLINGLPSYNDRHTDRTHTPISASRQSLDIGDWGYPVIYRNYRPLQAYATGAIPRDAVIDRTPDLDYLIRTVGNDVMARLLNLNEQDISHLIRLLNQPSTKDRATLDKLIRREDPLRVLLAGGDGENACLAVETSPVWFTHLLEAPGKLAWRGPTTSHAVHVRLWSVTTGNILETVTDSGSIDITAHDRPLIPSGVYIHWEVRQAGARQADSAMVRGIFKVLTPAQASLATLHLTLVHDLMRGIERDMAFAECGMRWFLYDDILKVFATDNPAMPATETFTRARIMANVFSQMRDQLSHRQHGDPEGIWATDAANALVDRSYVLLAGCDRQRL